ncbi:MAG: hypothetical protein ABI893_15205 [Polaromonas sp.]|uniref:hypothetical protein n=1 Tax=Polaromonas sp. TaxID=1869339 RepID=UPI00326507B7
MKYFRVPAALASHDAVVSDGAFAESLGVVTVGSDQPTFLPAFNLHTLKNQS